MFALNLLHFYLFIYLFIYLCFGMLIQGEKAFTALRSNEYKTLDGADETSKEANGL